MVVLLLLLLQLLLLLLLVAAVVMVLSALVLVKVDGSFDFFLISSFSLSVYDVSSLSLSSSLVPSS